MLTNLQRANRRKHRQRVNLPTAGHRLCVHRTSRFLYAQLIDQTTGLTILSGSDRATMIDKTTKSTKTASAAGFGEQFAKQVLDKKITAIYFDRGASRYHGRVKAFADAARLAGLQF